MALGAVALGAVALDAVALGAVALDAVALDLDRAIAYLCAPSAPTGSQMDDEEARRMRDDVRSQTVVRNVEDMLWRYNEEHEETLSVYDVVGLVLEGLIAEGMCPACIAESVQLAFERAGVDPAEHIQEGDGERPVMGRPDGDVFH